MYSKATQKEYNVLYKVALEKLSAVYGQPKLEEKNDGNQVNSRYRNTKSTPERQ